MNPGTDALMTEIDDIRLLSVEVDTVAGVPEDGGGATHVRVVLPASEEHRRVMAARGFVFGDRLLDVAVIPSRTRMDYRALTRIRPERVRAEAVREALLAVALPSFPYDRRFHVAPECDDALAAKVIRAWVADLTEVWVCRVRDAVAGFLAPRALDGGVVFVHLAAVAERFRSAGVGLSLYAGVLAEMEGTGGRTMTGTISSANVAVMNLYAALGGVFSRPRDVFLKTV